MTPIPRTPDAPGPRNAHVAFARTEAACADCNAPLPDPAAWRVRDGLLRCADCDARPKATAPATAQEIPVTPEQRQKHSAAMRAAYQRKRERGGAPKPVERKPSPADQWPRGDCGHPIRPGGTHRRCYACRLREGGRAATVAAVAAVAAVPAPAFDPAAHTAAAADLAALSPAKLARRHAEAREALEAVRREISRCIAELQALVEAA